ncbi:hypothetical protein KPH14_003815 [Odynerus spinipes]|uniref:Uncharacterized protein n=1 Tax=Odynerus spinipes TaxID=1348599 RepID=A0AAD9RXC5_9HYME|nr:hypothetical protein KPH14_003815 [Odynerus spinipes]
MGKTPKKAAPGGDERNLYVRRIKATTAPSKSSESNLHERQRESEISNRPSLSGVHKKTTPASTKRIKSLRCKLHSPANLSSSQATKALTKSLDSIVKDSRVQNTLQNLELTKQKMQPKLEEAETKINISIEKDEKEESAGNVGNKKEEATTKDSNANHTADEQDSTSTTHTEKKTAESIEEAKPADDEVKEQDKENDAKVIVDENNKELEEQEQDEIQLNLQVEDSPVKLQEPTSSDGTINDANETEKLSQIQEVNDDTKEKKSSQTESETGTETCSVDILESVTSDLSEVSEPPSQQDVQKETESSEHNLKSDASGVTYDASVTLKDVKIRLNDCLKENLKHADVSNVDSSTSNALSSESFGKTLRNISGRCSINRLRHKTSYDYRFTANESQFTNRSSVSTSPEETTNVRILRYSTGLSETISTNGSPVERKRKLESPDPVVTKKQKTKQGSLLNTSMDLLRGLRKPIQISTPNVGYKIQSDKLNISEINDGNDKLLPTHDEGTKKWCVIM